MTKQQLLDYIKSRTNKVTVTPKLDELPEGTIGIYNQNPYSFLESSSYFKKIKDTPIWKNEDFREFVLDLAEEIREEDSPSDELSLEDLTPALEDTPDNYKQLKVNVEEWSPELKEIPIENKVKLINQSIEKLFRRQVESDKRIKDCLERVEHLEKVYDLLNDNFVHQSSKITKLKIALRGLTEKVDEIDNVVFSSIRNGVNAKVLKGMQSQIDNLEDALIGDDSPEHED